MMHITTILVCVHHFNNLFIYTYYRSIIIFPLLFHNFLSRTSSVYDDGWWSNQEQTILNTHLLFLSKPKKNSLFFSFLLFVSQNFKIQICLFVDVHARETLFLLFNLRELWSFKVLLIFLLTFSFDMHWALSFFFSPCLSTILYHYSCQSL